MEWSWVCNLSYQTIEEGLRHIWFGVLRNQLYGSEVEGQENNEEGQGL